MSPMTKLHELRRHYPTLTGQSSPPKWPVYFKAKRTRHDTVGRIGSNITPSSTILPRGAQTGRSRVRDRRPARHCAWQGSASREIYTSGFIPSAGFDFLSNDYRRMGRSGWCRGIYRTRYDFAPRYFNCDRGTVDRGLDIAGDP